MANGSYYRFDDNDKTQYAYSHNHHKRHPRQNVPGKHFRSWILSDRSAEWYKWGSVMCKRTNTTIGSQSTLSFAHIIILHINKRSPSFSGIYMKPTAYDGTATSGTQTRKNMTTMIKFDISELMRIIPWVIKYSLDQLNLSGPVQHLQPHMLCRK